MNDMTLNAFKADHKVLVQSMLDEGILDCQFIQLQALQDASNPNFVAEVITLFCNEAERIITELDIYISQQDVDFTKMDANVHQLKGSSSSIGAQRVTKACAELREAADESNRDRCRQALNRIRQEYVTLQNKFQNLLQLEKAIFAIETNHKFPDGRYSVVTNMRHL